MSNISASSRRRRALHEQVLWIAEIAGRATESAHERERLARRLLEVRAELGDKP
jgi:hypothetical protein